MKDYVSEYWNSLCQLQLSALLLSIAVAPSLLNSTGLYSLHLGDTECPPFFTFSIYTQAACTLCPTVMQIDH